MKIVVFTTKIDKGAKAIKREAGKVSIDCQIMHYSNFEIASGELLCQ